MLVICAGLIEHVIIYERQRTPITDQIGSFKPRTIHLKHVG
jgi:hypothetical protein